MNGFIYNGKSTETILITSRLFLVTFDEVDSAPGVTRETIRGETTITRPVANEYGTTSTKLTFTYALIKENQVPFTDEEQRIVERWLTSPKISSKLQLFDDTGFVISSYCGKFITTEWKSCMKGWSGVVFTFEHNNTYPTRHFEFSYTITGSKTIYLNCPSDELEEYIYPIINLRVTSDTKKITLKNVTDNSNAMTLTADPELTNSKVPKLPIIFDCRHCIPSDATTNGIISYRDLGWNDVGNIYWLRLLPGINQLEFSGGDMELTISFDTPYKKVGGWMS